MHVGMYQLIKNLLQPYTLLMLVTALGLVFLWRKRSESRRRLLIVTLPFVLLFLISLPVVSYPLMGTLEWQYPPSPKRPEKAEALVVLMGGFARLDPADGIDPELYWDSVIRCMHAAKLYHDGKPIPVIVTGGKHDPADPGPAGAELMRDFLIRLGVREKDIIVEPKSRSTYEHAVNCKPLLDERSIQTIAVVTEATHIHRSVLTFRRHDIDAVPAPCGHAAIGFRWDVKLFLPQPMPAFNSVKVAHEWLGMAWYWMKDRI